MHQTKITPGSESSKTCDMADANGNERSVSLGDVVAYGLRLATLLQLCAEMGPSTKAPLQHIISEVNETTSALTQLEGTIRSDKEDAQKQGRLATYKPEGMAEVERLATQCLWIFRLILGLLERASQSKSRSTKLEGNPQALNTQLDPESLKLVSFFLRGLDDDSTDWLDSSVAMSSHTGSDRGFSCICNLQA